MAIEFVYRLGWKGWQPQAQLEDGFFPAIPKASGFEAATQSQADNLQIQA